MSEHLTHEQLESFGNGSASPAELARMDRHLSGCSQCRSGIPFDSHLVDSLSVLKDPDADHLSYELIEAYVQSQVDDIDREIVTSHTEFCSECAERVQGLQGFVNTLSTAAPEKYAAVAAASEPLSLWGRISATLKAPRWSYGIVGAAAAALVMAVIFQPRGDLGLSGSQTSGLIGVDSQMPTPVSVVQVPELLKQAADGSSSIPGLLVPNRIVVRTQRPAFRWAAMTGANSYRVEILKGSDSVMSDLITGTEWSPDFDLERGAVYSWRVTSYKDGEPLSPGASSTETARFGIVSEQDERVLSETLARFPDSHVSLASAYLGAGLIDDAERELNLVDSSDPMAILVRVQLEGIRQAIR